MTSLRILPGVTKLLIQAMESSESRMLAEAFFDGVPVVKFGRAEQEVIGYLRDCYPTCRNFSDHAAVSRVFDFGLCKLILC